MLEQELVLLLRQHLEGRNAVEGDPGEDGAEFHPCLAETRELRSAVG